MDVRRLLEDLRSPDYRVAVPAAERLRHVEGDAVTRALVAALNAPNTAITLMAAKSLIRRDAPDTADLMWEALPALEQNSPDYVWDAVEALPGEPVSRELARRAEEDPDT